jgi:N utilization substance protein A
MSNEIESAIRQICEEKGLSYESVIETIGQALAAAYRKDYGNRMQNIEVEFDPKTGGIKAYDVKSVVEDIPAEELERIKQEQADLAAKREAEEAARGFALPEREEAAPAAEGAVTFNPKTEIMQSDARLFKLNAAVGDVIRVELPIPGEFGRMAAMTAKQVITQKLREAEREIVFNEYKDQEGEVLMGTVQRREGRVVLVDLGRTVGVMVPEDQVPTERYNTGDRIKVFVREVALSTRGPQIMLSRTSEELVRKLFSVEIPEIGDGTVQIKNISREAGSRTKIAVSTNDSSIDPIGACIGQRGVRIQTIIAELGGEKIDVIEWSENPKTYIQNSLSPAKVQSVDLDEAGKSAVIIVNSDQLSLAIGRGGQNVRLAAKLTGWKINIREEGQPATEEVAVEVQE